MIISRTPLRVSLVGGGTDMEYFYSQHSGQVISFAVDKYIYIIVKSRFDNNIVLNYKDREIVQSVDDIKHSLIRECLKKVGIDKSIEITSIADIPSSGSGLGSSSAFTVGVLNALYTFVGLQKNQKQLAEEACEIEIDILKAPIGKQDQYGSSLGGLKKITFNKNGSIKISKINDENNLYENLANNIILVNSNLYRDASKILQEQKSNLSENLDTLIDIKNSVQGVESIIKDQDFNSFYPILNKYFKHKSTLVRGESKERLEKIYNHYVPDLCHAGKICGAGAGGYFLFFIKENFIFNRKKHIKTNIDKFGSVIIYNNY